jgi:drug/metabolite transporter (DMT)-like permease
VDSIKISVWLAFVVYCLLASAAWIVTPFGEGASFFERQVILFAVAGVGAIAFSRKKLRTAGRRLPWVRMVVAGVSFWGVPACLIHGTGSGVPSITISATFALLPAVVVLVTTIDGTIWGQGDGWGYLVPALAAFGGILLLLPVGLPESVRGQLGSTLVFVAVILVAVSSVWMHRLMQGVAIAETMFIVCFANAAFLAICGLVARDFVGGWAGLRTVLSLSSCVDLIQVILVFWLLREMQPVRFAARYLVIPLLTVVEGYVVLRPEVTARMVVGAVLLVGGTVWVLFSKASDDEVILSLR